MGLIQFLAQKLLELAKLIVIAIQIKFNSEIGSVEG